MLKRLGSETLFPARFGVHVRRRTTEFGGILLWVVGLGLALALLTYNPRDPSANAATQMAPTNWLGLGGSYIADLLLPWFGVVSYLPVLALLAWGWRIVRHSGSGGLWWRGLAMLFALPVSAGTIATLWVLIPTLPHVFWPDEAGLGGAFGQLIAEEGVAAGSAAMGRPGALVLWVLGGALTALLVLLALGLQTSEWRALWRGTRYACRLPVRLYRFLSGLTQRGTHEAPAQDGRTYAGSMSGMRDPRASSQPDYDESPFAASRREAAAATYGGGALTVREEAATARQPEAAENASVFMLSGPAAAQSPVRQDDKAPLFKRLLGGGNKAERAFVGAERPVSAPASTPVAAPPAAAPKRVWPAAPAPAAPVNSAGWHFPSLDLLRPSPAHVGSGPSQEMLQANARLLETVLADYGVQGSIGDIHAGPVVTLYELEPAPGIRSARVIGLADDIARSLSVLSVRIATVPGRNVIGIEVPNALRETVYYSEMLDNPAWRQNSSKLCLALGKDIAGAPVYVDLARMPHLLIAGTTGSGKSVGVNSMILSLLYRMSPSECRLIMIDPKILELSIYDGIPHLMTPVVTEPAKAVTALKWTVREMDRRYRAMAHLQVRNIGGYNDRVAEAQARGEIVTRRVQTGYDQETGRPIFEEQQLALETLPFIVVVIDEVADLMMVAGKEIEIAVQRLAQKARAAGIHVIMATQRPSVDVITGTIKANFPTRISFQVISKFDSRTILGEQGAEQLLGQGDMLYMQGGGRITRVHGPFVSDPEVEGVVAFLRSQGEPVYNDDVTSADEEEGSSGSSGGGSSGNGLGGGGYDGETSLFDQAVAIVAREGKASTSFIQRHLSIGYNRAAKLIEQMEKEGIVSQANHVGRREVLIRRTEED